MPWKSAPEIWNLVGAFIVSFISGFISISRRIVNGYNFSLLWVITEFMTAILAGYLMFTAYPHIQGDVPEWFTLPIAVALAAHAGGRIFQEVENDLLNRYFRCKYGRRKTDHSK